MSPAASAGDLAGRFAEPVPLEGRPLGEVLARIDRDLLSGVNRLAHPMYMGHQVSAPLAAAIWMESLKAAVNNSAAVREMSPAGTAVERQVIRWMCDLAGLGAEAGGTFTSGGTEATFTALLAARARALPDAWERGVGEGAPVVLAGEHAHYAVTRAVAELGLGMRRAVAVPSRDHRMDTRALAGRLAQLRAEGVPVMAVVATAGSTATGSFDDLDTIGRLCEEHDAWLHVDGAHGASALVSARHRHRVRGIERARSIAWDPHKLLLMPLGTGMLLVRDEAELDRAFLQRAPYLFHGAGGRVLDQGVRSFLCSRPVDVLKLWVALQRYGLEGLAAAHDHLCDVAHGLWELIGTRDDFEAMHEPESNILCFRWRGPGLDDEALDDRNRRLREAYNLSGAGWITTTVLDGRRVLRVTIMNPRTRASHTRALLDGLAVEAARL
ncbi:MAG TPA: aminotransferase class V-fold PLP-dependent enzyme [Gemmatimonadales bacterium]|nr:aminotransferase class V-fold PLP-dependent enzyme [Gemmatimonadales bacterium]